MENVHFHLNENEETAASSTTRSCLVRGTTANQRQFHVH